MLRILMFIVVTAQFETTFTWNLNFNNHRNDDVFESFNRHSYDDKDDYDVQNDFSFSRSPNDIPPLTKTQYYYKTHQRATVSIPKHHRHSRIPISPDEKETQSYVTKVDTTHLGPRKKRFRDDDDDESNHHLKPFFRTGKFCIKCPPEKILIAKRGLDGVLVETPQLTTCNDKPISKQLYELETLFSKKHSYILPRGSHSFIGQIVSKKNYTVEHVCYLKFKIIVRSCGPYIPQNEGIKVKCDLGDIWGSKCSFFCKNNGILTHREQIVCNDNLQWQGIEPDCIIQHRDYFKRIEGAISSCQLPAAPDHAKFSCKVNRDLINEYENELFIPDGTFCRVKCSRFYEISENLQKYASFSCHNGRWNYTQQSNFCTKIQQKRFT